MSTRAVALLSGGLNSFIAAKFAQTVGHEIVEGICLNYGQAHGDEIEAARDQARYLNVPFSVFNPQMMWELTDRMPQSLAQHLVGDGLNESFWLGRGLMIMVLGASRAQTLGADCVVTGFTGMRVVSPAWDLFAKCIEASGFTITMEHPFIDTEPGHVFKVAHAIGAWDEAVAMTYDCLTGSHDIHEWGAGCGECRGCKRRITSHNIAKEMLLEQLSRTAEVPS